jgi:hypothetical protein
MTRLMLATVAGAALLAGVGAASAQTYRGGYAYERGVGPSYGYGTGDWNYSHPTPYNSSAPRGGTYKMNAFKSQELLPQSPPAGGP